MKKRIEIDELPDINDLLGNDTLPPVTTFEEADKIADKRNSLKSGRPIIGHSRATKKLAFHVDEETYNILIEMMNFPVEKSANAVAKRIVTSYCEPLIKKVK